jgi:hypothetical protein
MRTITGDDGGGLREPALVRLHVLTEERLLSADVNEDAFRGKTPHPLTPVIAGVQDVLSQLRIVSPS